MRKSLLTLLFVIVCIWGNAQKGSVLTYGYLYLSSEKNSIDGNSSKTTNFGVKPGIGYQIADKWTLGLNLGYERQSPGYYEANKYTVGPFVRYTKKLTELISVFGQFQAGYAQNNLSGDQTYKFITLNAFPAIELNLGKGFGLNFNLWGLDYESFKIDGRPGSFDKLNLTIGTGIGFGISKRF